ncbi:hypothetical protein F2P79_017447 [Pimephales promelas]|nr:hypothetical protein F2P79_017447 [Pimephales promelas]
MTVSFETSFFVHRSSGRVVYASRCSEPVLFVFFVKVKEDSATQACRGTKPVPPFRPETGGEREREQGFAFV